MGTIFVAGTYGVGKSTLCNKLSTALKIPDFSAGDLISAVNGETYGANKVVRDKDANQNILASQVKQLLKSTPSIILAGHFCIFDINGNVDTLPSRVFYDLEIICPCETKKSIPKVKFYFYKKQNTKRHMRLLQA